MLGINWKKESKNKLAGVFFLIIFVSSLFFSFPQKSHAQYAVFDATSLAQSIIDYTIQIAQYGQEYLTAFNTYYIMYKEMVLDPLAWITSKIELAKQVKKIIEFANSGNSGNPKFVLDLADTMLAVASGAANDFLLNNGTVNWEAILCKKTNYDLTGIKPALVNRYNKNLNFKLKIQCPDIANAVSDIGAFVAGDFNQGGIDGWFELTQNSGGTVYGAYLASQQELDRQIAEAEFNEWTELMWGDGFTSTEVDPTKTNLARPGGSSGIKTPGSLILGQVNSALAVGKEALVAVDEFSELLTNALASIGADALGGGGSGNTGFVDYTLATSDLSAETPPELEPQTPPVLDGGGVTPPGGVIDLALNQPCLQSGQYSTFACKFANDADTVPASRNNIATGNRVIYPWWSVDFSKSAAIDTVTIYRATQIPGSGLGNPISSATAIGQYRIFVSDSPFPNDSPTPDLTQFDPTSFPPNVWSAGPASMGGAQVWASAPRTMPSTGPDSDIAIGIAGRYLRVQRVDNPTNTRYLALVEVIALSSSVPVITLTGPSTINLSTGDSYTDLGATAFDQLDGDITANIVRTGYPFDTNALGAHAVAYDVKNSNNVPATQVSRTVNVIPQPVVTLTGTLNASSQPTLTWTTNNSSSNLLACVASQGWSGNKNAAGGTQTLSPISSSQAYTLTCSNSLGQLASKTIYLALPGKPTVAIKANGADGFALIPYNSSAMIDWSSTGATSCIGDWAGGAVPASGSVNTGSLTINKSYSVICTDGSGNSAQATAIVDVALTTAACAVSDTAVLLGESVIWSIATPTGGTGAYTYSWTGTDGLTGVAGSLPRSYTKTGLKYGAVTVTSGDQKISDILCPIVTITPITP